MNTPELVEWQRIDPETSLVECWWTHPCLDVINTWDLRKKVWLEFGAGLGTASLRQKCKWVDSIEANEEWAFKAEAYCEANNLHNGKIHSCNIPDGMPQVMQEYFNLIPRGLMSHYDLEYDIISVDGIYRNECLQWAIDHFKGRGGKLIVDNFDQDYVWISPAAVELMAPYECTTFYQPEHTNHEGKPWNTRIFIIPA